MYLLFADESGTHGGSHSFVVGGIAVHEHDAQSLQRSLDAVVARGVRRLGISPDEFELHAAEIRNAGSKSTSPWRLLDRQRRLAILNDAYRALSTFRASDPRTPLAFFGVVVDKGFHSSMPMVDRERFAYEVLLNKFDVMLKRLRTGRDRVNRGLVIHDRRVVAERDIQEWTRDWQKAAGTVGQLRNLADVPLFADSRASRLLQAADLISYSLYRHYDPNRVGEDYVGPLWPRFDADDGAMHGCVHYTPSYGSGSCTCQPCEARLTADSVRRTAVPVPDP